MTAQRKDTDPGHALTTSEALKIGTLDAHDQAALQERGELAPGGLVEAAILRIEQIDPQLNAITFTDFDKARRQARRASGDMAGVPWLLKDGLDYPGMPCRAGSRSRISAPPGTCSFPYTDRLDSQGLVALGKTNAPEFGLLPTTEPVLYGPTRNPWARDRSPGGSSGGAAAAVASGMVPLAHAADGGGSIRIPASCCGVIGLKPGRGANLRARAPHLIEDLIACDVLLSRSARDVAWAFHAASPGGDVPAERPASGDRRRVALCMDNLWGDAPEPQVRDVIVRTAELCTSLGHDVEERSLPVNGPAVLKSFQTLWGYLARDVAALCSAAENADLLEPWTRDLAAWSDGLGVLDMESLVLETARATAALDAFFADYDLILSPVLRRPALEIGALSPARSFDHIMTLMYDYVSYTPLHNLTGLPAISLPVFSGADGVPIGSMFAAARGREDQLLGLAGELEAATSWTERWPPVSARALSKEKTEAHHVTGD